MMRPVSAELAKHITESLSSVFGSISLLADGHEVLAKCEFHNRKLVVAVYVDGVIKGVHMSKDSEIGRKFWRPVKGRIWKKSEFKSLARCFGKKRATEMTGLKLLCYQPWFASPRAFIAHINKTCTSVQLAPVKEESHVA